MTDRWEGLEHRDLESCYRMFYLIWAGVPTALFTLSCISPFHLLSWDRHLSDQTMQELATQYICVHAVATRKVFAWHNTPYLFNPLTWQFRSVPKLSKRSSGKVGDRREGGSVATLPGGVLNCQEPHLWAPIQHLHVIHCVTLDKPGNLSHLLSTRKPPHWCSLGCTSQCDPKQ